MLRSRFLLTWLVSATAAYAATTECDRVCLKSTLDQYLNAVVKHDPAAAPLFVGGAITIAYDVLLYRAFRNVRAPEEA